MPGNQASLCMCVNGHTCSHAATHNPRASPDVHAAEGVGVLGILQQLLHLPLHATGLTLACARPGGVVRDSGKREIGGWA